MNPDSSPLQMDIIIQFYLWDATKMSNQTHRGCTTTERSMEIHRHQSYCHRKYSNGLPVDRMSHDPAKVSYCSQWFCVIPKSDSTRAHFWWFLHIDFGADSGDSAHLHVYLAAMLPGFCIGWGQYMPLLLLKGSDKNRRSRCFGLLSRSNWSF